MRIKISLVLFLTTLFLLTGLYGHEIHETVKKGDLAAVKKLILADSNLVNLPDENQRTPLHWACRGTNLELIAFLVKNKANVNALDVNNVVPLHSAVARENLKAAKLLIKHKARVDVSSQSGTTPLHYAAVRGNVEIVKLLLKQGAPLEVRNDYQRTPLLLAAREMGGIEVIKVLVKAGVNVNARDYSQDTSLSLAAWRGSEDVVDYLIDQKADIDISGRKGAFLFYFAVNKRLVKLFQEIVQRGGDVRGLSRKGQTALHWAAKGGSVKIIQDLIDRGLLVNHKDIFGYIPLHYAAKYGRLQAVKLLVEKGAKLNSRLKTGESPLNLAQRMGKKEVIDYLKAKGAEIKKITKTNIKGAYFGQKAPKDKAQYFAAGIVSNLVGGHSNVTFSQDGMMAVWTEWNETEKGYTDGCTLWFSRLKKGYWIQPVILQKKGDTPVFTPDGRRLYFLAFIPRGEGQRDAVEIQYYEIKNGSLLKPKSANFDKNTTGLYWQFTLDKDWNIYFSGRNGLCRSLYKEGRYLPHEKLTDIFHPDYKGGSPYIAPDASYIIFSSRSFPKNTIGRMDLYIGFKKPDGTWTPPVNMGDAVNGPNDEHLAMVSNDGKYLFFRGDREGLSGIQWISAKIIHRIKAKVLQ